MPLNHRIRVLLVDDHTIVREGLKLLISSAPSLEVVGEAKDGRQAVALTATLRPDVVVMDVAMPEMNGEVATQKITCRHPEIKVLVLSSYSDEQIVDRLMQAGAAGYITKSSAATLLIAAIEQIYRGEKVLGTALTHFVFSGTKSHLARGTRRGLALSPREGEVLQLIAEGRQNRDIAQVLGISFKTVEKHRQGVMVKLDLHDTASLTRYAVSHGITQADPPSPRS
jgi:DNA-binding NarL/FixJ family response regulator